MLLGLVDLSKYQVCPDVLVAREVFRLKITHLSLSTNG